MYLLASSKDAEKFLKGCHPKMKESLKRQLSVLADMPRERGSSLDGEFRGLYRIELSHRDVSYRAIYEIDDVDMMVFILFIDKREQVYERAKRKQFARR